MARLRYGKPNRIWDVAPRGACSGRPTKRRRAGSEFDPPGC